MPEIFCKSYRLPHDRQYFCNISLSFMHPKAAIDKDFYSYNNDFKSNRIILKG